MLQFTEKKRIGKMEDKKITYLNDEDEDLLRVISENCGGNLLLKKAPKESVPEENKETDDMPDEPILF